jgi:hypothetical protein
MGYAMKKLAPPNIDSLITTVCGQKVILDAELARIYGAPTKALNQAVKRNRDKFPEDFLFRLTPQEAQEARQPVEVPAVPENTPNRSQTVTGSQKHRDPRYLPYAFTEHGAIMAANVLNSARATQMSVFVVRAFVKMRSAFKDRDWLAAVHGNDDLPPVGVAPLLVATTLTHAREAALAEHPNHFISVTDWEVVAQGKATSRSLPFFGMSTGLESNHNARACLPLATASSSLSPALAHPGKSGNTADQRPVCASYSSSSRNFMVELYP